MFSSLELVDTKIAKNHSRKASVLNLYRDNFPYLHRNKTLHTHRFLHFQQPTSLLHLSFRDKKAHKGSTSEYKNRSLSWFRTKSDHIRSFALNVSCLKFLADFSSASKSIAFLQYPVRSLTLSKTFDCYSVSNCTFLTSTPQNALPYIEVQATNQFSNEISTIFVHWLICAYGRCQNLLLGE